MSHKKVCEICGLEFEESDDIFELAIKGPAKCPECVLLQDLEDFYNNYTNKNYSKEHNSEIYHKNFIPFNDYTGSVLDDYDEEWLWTTKNRFLEDFVKRVKEGRNFLFQRIKPQIEILDSFFINKLEFWRESLNGAYYIREASLNYTFIKINECFQGKDCSYSISKLKNLLINNINLFYSNKVIHRIRFKKSQDLIENEFTKFPIDEFLIKLDTIEKFFDPQLKAIKLIRDKECAHNEKIDLSMYEPLDYKMLKRLLGLLLKMYDGFLLAATLHERYSTYYDFNINLKGVNELFKAGKKKREDEIKELEAEIKNLKKQNN